MHIRSHIGILRFTLSHINITLTITPHVPIQVTLSGMKNSFEYNIELSTLSTHTHTHTLPLPEHRMPVSPNTGGRVEWGPGVLSRAILNSETPEFAVRSGEH